MSYHGLYASDGSWNISVVSGSSTTGLYAADGSINVIASPGSSYVGAYHPCGALYVTVCASSPKAIRAADGSLNISYGTYYSETQKCTIVSGGFSPGTGALIPLLVW